MALYHGGKIEIACNINDPYEMPLEKVKARLEHFAKFSGLKINPNHVVVGLSEAELFERTIKALKLY